MAYNKSLDSLIIFVIQFFYWSLLCRNFSFLRLLIIHLLDLQNCFMGLWFYGVLVFNRSIYRNTLYYFGTLYSRVLKGRFLRLLI